MRVHCSAQAMEIITMKQHGNVGNAGHADLFKLPELNVHRSTKNSRKRPKAAFHAP